ncbi:hypothetical protein OG365_04455 [Streptomyces sp. NBC_00853]|nr:hypothetical protein OG365_04455 [Streptomyces sp. NBC_00853]
MRTTSPIAPYITVNTFRHIAQTDIYGETSELESAPAGSPRW